MNVLTNSEIRTFRRCQREWFFAYSLKRRPRRDAEPLRFGTLLHKALEAWWRTADDRYGAAVEAVEAYVDADEFDRVKAEELMLGYTARWMNEPLTAIGVEVEFRVEMVNPATGHTSRTFDLGGKIDVIVEEAGRRKLVVEHKTTSEDISLGSDYWRRVSATDSQVSAYLAGARAAGFDVQGCLYDVLRKPGIRPSEVSIRDEDGTAIVLDAVGQRVRTKDGKKWRETGDKDQGFTVQKRPETPEEFRERLRADILARPDRYYARGEFVRLEADETDHQYDVWQTGRLIREAELTKRFPRNPDSCIRFGRECPYFGVCSREASIEDDTLYRTAETTHEELGEVA